MSNISLPWPVEMITVEESVGKMISVIESKRIQHSGTFWTYEDTVRIIASFLK